MKILIVHNEYGHNSREDIVVSNIQDLLTQNGHDIVTYFRNGAEIYQTVMRSARSLFSGLHNGKAIKDLQQIIEKDPPDIIHIHNVHPLITSSILPALKPTGIPVVMTVHNYQMICPNGLFLKDEKVCEKCAGGKEYNCIINNCEDKFLKSVDSAFRVYMARKKKHFTENVTLFACLTEFQRNKLISEGYPEEKLRVISNVSPIDGESFNSSMDNAQQIGFIGNIDQKKGINVLISASKELIDIPFRAAGSIENMPEALSLVDANFGFSGHLDRNGLKQFTEKCKMIVLPTLCYEGFPMAIVEAMYHGRPVICSKIGGLPEIVEDGVTGLLFEPGNPRDLSNKIKYLWENPEICLKMGQAGRDKAITHYSSTRYYASLSKMYHEAIDMETQH